MILLITGCSVGRHTGRIEAFDAQGESTGHYIVTLDRPMMMEAGTVKADSRGESSWGSFLKGAFEIATLGLMMND